MRDNQHAICENEGPNIGADSSLSAQLAETIGNNEMNVADFLQELDNLFELDPGTLNQESVVEEVPGWSSLTFLGLISLIEDLYQVTMKPRQVHQCHTVGDLYSFVEKTRSSKTAR